ncbi:tRNA (adenosine(37)-N6)-threonylcarbamoyltransferase complex dimerization subunit type 1 TsaB [Jannaschia aquimarina]|uniref:TsaB protein n=1 Tax=Jannaschia aquimarina TaxID=935700 RepID=A0A0D1DCE8_9RHOB|nr:tRNA (adenosine(37)-N6)-threonylcarbamoyltransferase complex dimerization subunit type 1 TsaB [Jannaschia aquimarina]KIT17663.1 tRNA threonylcarbamoyladenosine biosynthesis protein TsaB [Jannaschia aquimarina]SNS79631.1 tRNA threonylcarbamoyl adenosine modification protein YeaZ [Jannaschia aquimarina]
MRRLDLVLGFDTSAGHCRAALVHKGEIVAEAHEEMARGQAERLLPLLADVLRKGGADWQEIDALGVGTGPGNFTGIRLGVAAARGLSLGLDIPAEGVSAIDALALERGDVTVALPAPRGGLHLGHRGHVVSLSAGDPWPEGWPTRVAGPGAERLDGVDYVEAAPLAASIARIASARAGPGRPRPAPIYLRAADAAKPADRPPMILPG